MAVQMPPMTAAQGQAWNALLDLHERKPTGWTLVGGQMVHLHCAERGADPARPTDDVDAVMDVRAEPNALLEFTRQLQALGFKPAGTSPTGHQHRWTREQAQIDVLIPRHLGQKAATRKGAAGGTTIETPGAQQALDRTQEVEIRVGDRIGTVRRPSLLGALVGKGAAYGVTLDRARTRHLVDFAVLSTLVRRGDQIGSAGPRDRVHLDNALGALANDPRLVATVEGGAQGIERVRLALRQSAAPATVGSDAQGRVPAGVREGGQFAARRRGESSAQL